MEWDSFLKISNFFVFLNYLGFFVGDKDGNIFLLDETGSPSGTLKGHLGPVRIIYKSAIRYHQKRIIFDRKGSF